MKPFNGRTSGSERGHHDHRTSWAPYDGCRRRGVCGRTGQEPASAGSWSAHRRTSGSRRRWTWRWPDGWRKPGRCDHHRRRGHGCRHRRTCRLQRSGGARRPIPISRVNSIRHCHFVEKVRQVSMYLEAEDLRLDQREGLAVDPDHALALL